MATYGWYLDPKRCIECRACEAACKQWNGVPTGINVRYRRVQVFESGKYENVQTQALSMACNHCENALCMKACPAKAIYRHEATGAVLVDQKKCLGCGMCGKFCPYDAPQYNPTTRLMQKCTMCFDRVEERLQPACATLCPTGALQWGPWDEIKGKGVAQVPNFDDPKTTSPRIRFENKPYGVK
ncbi:MAG: 4Fe-4S dicluster domain-containing protein [Bryobacter sp.]|jgi:anaerobic dimethyl sulfoxide reductase subunit B (iron-sulfur subunit)|nr:4Fe-4S dicluster domain-containing protein [Bryobacter sp.]